jgi:hypothetical protein
MPRLDWQMWFAAMGDVRSHPWFVRFCVGLLEGRQEVLSLLGTNPFPQTPPKFIRAMLYEYSFTTVKEKEKGAGWWKRESLGVYLPPISLRREET